VSKTPSKKTKAAAAAAIVVQPPTPAAPAQPLRIDIGCGKNKKAGFVGIDSLALPGVDFYCDIRKAPWTLEPFVIGDAQPPEPKARTVCKQLPDGKWLYTVLGTEPLADNSVDEAHCSHFIEHLTNLDDKWERTHFFNELYRVLKPGASCSLVLPHWASNRYYGDPTHKEPFSEMGFFYLSKDWRLSQAPHTDAQITGNPSLYSCDFEATWGYSLHQALQLRNQEYQQNALTFWKEAAQDLVANLKKKA